MSIIKIIKRHPASRGCSQHALRWNHFATYTEMTSVEFRKQAEISALDKELDARKSMPAAQASEIEAVFATEDLLKRRGAVISEELNASLEVMTVQSFLVETEVSRQRLLHHIAAIPFGFNRYPPPPPRPPSLSAVPIPSLGALLPQSLYVPVKLHQLGWLVIYKDNGCLHIIGSPTPYIRNGIPGVLES
jgi:hypothetical protein